MVCDRVYELKTIISTFLMLVTPKNYEYLNELRGALSLQSQTNANT